MLLVWVTVFVLSLAVLIKASDYFIVVCEKIGVALHIPSYTIGATVVALGTSLPELVSSIVAVAQGSSEIVVGNVVGSNITNVLLIFGITAVVARVLYLDHTKLQVDSELFIGSALVMTCLIWDKTFSRLDGVICIVLCCYYFHRVSRAHKRGKREEHLPEERFRNADAVILIASTFLIWLGGKYCVVSVIKLSTLLNVGAEIIAATAIAFGTSLPELAVTWSAAKRGRPEIALGNVLGSNIFNALGVMGIPALIGPLVIPSTIFNFGVPVMLFATLCFWFLTHRRKKQIARWQGVVLLAFYVLFIGRMVFFS